MIGIVISDTFLITGVWSNADNDPTLHNVKQIDYTEPINDIIHKEGELSSALGIALRRVSESIPFSGQDIAVAISDEFLYHDSVETEIDLAREDYWDYVSWIEKNKNRPPHQKMSIFGQIYLPDEINIHTVSCPTTLIRTIKLSVSELGGNPYWMGPSSSVVIDAGYVSDAGMVIKKKNQYKFYMVKNCRFDHGIIAFTSGQPKVISSTKSDEYTLGSFKLIQSDIDDIPIYSPDKLGRQALSCWERSDLRKMDPFEDVKLSSSISDSTDHYESNILTSLVLGASSRHSFNFFDEEKISDFLFTEVFSEEKDIEREPFSLPQTPIAKEKRVRKNDPITGGEMVWLLFALIVIMGLFFAMNYIKFRESINKPLFGGDDNYVIKKIDPIYCAAIAPVSIFPEVSRSRGIPIVRMIPVVTNVRPEANLEPSTVQLRKGCVNSNSRVPSLNSSANKRIVAAGIKIAKINGSASKRALREASWLPAARAVRKNNQEVTPTKITSKTYPVGWSKYPLRSLRSRAKNVFIG